MLMAVLLILIALGERLWFDLGPNVELVTMVSVVAGMYLPRRWAWVVPGVVMGVSNWVLGGGWITMFTMTGFVVMVWLPRLVEKVGKRKVVVGLGSGLVGNLMFYWWTNFGVWLTERWGMYADDLGGLVACYVNGLPFLKLQLVSTLVFVPVGVLVVEEVRRWKERVELTGVLRRWENS